MDGDGLFWLAAEVLLRKTLTMTRVHHVALLVPSVAKAGNVLAQRGLAVFPAEEWEAEGTREIYVGEAEFSARLLLMEPTREGSYRRALERRGPGLHHVGIDVLELEPFIERISGSGWYLHPHSLATIRVTRTAWLVRPGVPVMIEVQERKTISEAPAFVRRLLLPNTERDRAMFAAIGIAHLFSESTALEIETVAASFSIDDLI